MPRLRKYVSTSVPAIGCDMANRRRAASGDPIGAGDRAAFRRGLRVGPRQAEEASGLVGDIVEIDKAAAFADDVEQIAMLACGGVGPFAGGALAGFRPLSRTNIERPGVLRDVADQPIAAFAAAVGEIMAAHRLGLAREAARQFGGIARHHAASRSPTRATG